MQFKENYSDLAFGTLYLFGEIGGHWPEPREVQDKPRAFN